jgi:hypothetical protein
MEFNAMHGTSTEYKILVKENKRYGITQINGDVL